MRTLTRALCILILALTAYDLAQAQAGILWVKVSDLNGRPMLNIRVGTDGPGSIVVTKEGGLAKIILASGTKASSWVTLQVLSKSYEFVSPYDKRVLVPPFEGGSENYVRVFLVRVGDLEALKSGRFAVALAAKFNATLKPKQSVPSARRLDTPQTLSSRRAEGTLSATPVATDCANSYAE